ncbi:MAG: site-2 protease family protein [Gammaproteobacteria bacterium]|nr:site-2 protease family protein [Gammaproteobacteria bacterium]
MPESLNLVQKIAIWVIPALFAITLHEVAHGFVANRLGDPTAKMLGRLSVNPFRHIDLFGTIIVPLVMLFLPGGFIFGWAKPVPVGERNLGNPRRDMALVGAAGPAANFLMAVAWALVIRLGLALSASASSIALPIALAGVAGVFINSLLMVFNLLPLPPLDGGRVAVSLMPPRYARVYERVEPFGIWIIVLLLFTGVLGFVLYPVLQGCFSFFALFAGVSPGNLWYLLGNLM